MTTTPTQAAEPLPTEVKLEDICMQLIWADPTPLTVVCDSNPIPSTCAFGVLLDR